MTIIVSKQILQTLEACQEGQPGFDWLVNELGNGDENFQIPHNELLEAIRTVDKPQEDKVLWYLYIKDLKENINFYQMQGAIQMTEKYHVFNPLTGQHEEAASIDEARSIKAKIINDYIEANKNLFVISQEAYIADEDRSLWKQVE